MHPRHTQALADLPPPLVPVLLAIVQTAEFAGSLSPSDIQRLQQSSGLSESELALQLLPFAASYALTPISQFAVGAIAHGSSGHWYFGANMEFVGMALQQTLHAEQSAISHAWMRGEAAIEAVTVNFSPCGHCRQFMNELNSANRLSIRLPERAPRLLHDYLPDAFGPQDLGQQEGLFAIQDHGFSLSGDALEQAAIRAANRSYAPYSQAYSGVALRSAQGHIVSGSYAENAAYNPSLPPLQTALIMLNLQNNPSFTIDAAVIAERKDAVVTQQVSSKALLAALGCQQITRLWLTHSEPHE